MSRKGLSFEEKRKRLAEIFYEKTEFYQLKELEKIAPKQKGIIVQSVKEVLQSLVDDSLVDCEKIGTSIYFWAFPSKALSTRQHRIETLKSELDKQGKIKVDLQQQLTTEQQQRQTTDERTKLLKQLADLQAEKKCLTEKLALYRESDPLVIEAKRQAIKDAIAASNRWADNISTLQSYCIRKFNMAQKDFLRQFSVPEELEEVDEKWLLAERKPQKRSFEEGEEGEGEDRQSNEQFGMDDDVDRYGDDQPRQRDPEEEYDGEDFKRQKFMEESEQYAENMPVLNNMAYDD